MVVLPVPIGQNLGAQGAADHAHQGCGQAGQLGGEFFARWGGQK
jgi:hypothetical protein